MKKRISKMLKWIFFLLIAAHLVSVFFVVKINYQNVFIKRTIPKAQQELNIPKGQSLNFLLSRLAKNDLAPNSFWVKMAMQIHKKNFVLKKGRYVLDESMSTWDILVLLDRGLVKRTKVTIREGLEKWEVAKLLGETKWGSEEQFLELIENPEMIKDIDPGAKDLEGYLLPETYQFEDETTPEQIVKTMVEQFKLKAVSQAYKLADLNITIREWVTIASMVEKETGVADERSRIAGVFFNRKRRGMQYQCDPTIVYALKREGKYRGKIYRSDLKFDSPYNTYVSPALPPGPIANPGLDALLAVLNPEEHKFYYFVSKNDGTHQFSTSLAEHNRFVRKYQR